MRTQGALLPVISASAQDRGDNPAGVRDALWNIVSECIDPPAGAARTSSTCTSYASSPTPARVAELSGVWEAAERLAQGRLDRGAEKAFGRAACR